MTSKILIFESTHKVMKAEQILAGMNVRFDIIPTPKEYSSNCGMSIRLDSAINDLQMIQSAFKHNNIIFSIHDKEI